MNTPERFVLGAWKLHSHYQLHWLPTINALMETLIKVIIQTNAIFVLYIDHLIGKEISY